MGGRSGRGIRARGARRALSAILAIAIAAALLPAGAFAAAGDVYAYDQINDRNYMANTGITERTEANNGSRKIAVPRAQGEAAFTAEGITVDAVREAAWDAATAYPVSRLFNGTLTAAAETGATGTVRYLWDGPVLYALVEVTGDTTAATANQTWTGASLAANANADGVAFGIDVFNDRWGMENDTTTWFFVNRNSTAYVMYGSTNIPSLSSFLYASNPDYSPRVKAVAGSAYSAASDSSDVNYTYEVAIDVEGWGDAWDYELENGVKVGMEIGVMDGNRTWAFWSKTNPTDAREGSSNLPNDERTRNRDWGEVALAGWDGEAQFAYSSFRADEAIRFWNSPNNPGAGGNYTGTGNGDNSEVWRADTKSRMIAAKAAYLAVKDSPTTARAVKEVMIREVCEAFAGLRWADETFPDPHDLPAEFTVPDPYKFFDPSKGTDGYVTTLAEWEERKAEILALAEFYEYGYKPQLGVDYTISITTNSYAGTGNASVVARVTPTNAGYWRGGAAQDITVAVTNPQLYNGQKVGLGFGVSGSGLAAVTNPTGWPFGDTRNDTVWGARRGTFVSLFPYERNRVGTDVSNAMAYATGVTVTLDILEAASAANAALAARIDVSKAAASGFSYLGKYAFVAAVYDERVAVAFSGAAGATGPANWRYNVQGQEYDFSGTIYSSNSAGAANVVAFGTEGPGNSYRHNRARETELFRHFMPYGHMYEHLEGAYNYGEYSRMPFDNALLLAAFVPDRMIVLDNCLNDFNDGAGTDNMSLQLGRAMFRAMGADPDQYVKINSANYAPSGDPHGYSTGRVADAQIASDFLFGTSLVSEANNERLIADPFDLLIANGQTESAYDYYWGGFNTITGGTGGVDGRDGWYYVNLIRDAGALEAAAEAADAAVGDAEAGDYTEASWARYSAARDAARAILDDPYADDVSQVMIDGALAELTAAVAGLTVEKGGLGAAIEAAEALAADKYSPPTYNNVVLALAEARSAYEDADATPARVKAALGALAAAIDGLDEYIVEQGIYLGALEGVVSWLSDVVELGVYADTAELRSVLAEAEETIARVRSVLIANGTPYGMSTLGEIEISQDEIDELFDALIGLLGALTLKPAYAEDVGFAALLQELTESNALNADEWDGASFGELRDKAREGWLLVTEVVLLVEDAGTPRTVAEALSELATGSGDVVLLYNELYMLRSGLGRAGSPAITISGGVYADNAVQNLMVQYASGAEAAFDFKVANFENVGVAYFKFSLLENENLDYDAITIAKHAGLSADSDITLLETPKWPGYRTWQVALYAPQHTYLTLADDEVLFSVKVPLKANDDTVALASATDYEISYLDAETLEETAANSYTTRLSDAVTIRFVSRFDINRDGKVDIADVGLVRRFLGAVRTAGVWTASPGLDPLLWNETYAARSNLNIELDADDKIVLDVNGEPIYIDDIVDTIDLSIILADYAS